MIIDNLYSGMIMKFIIGHSYNIALFTQKRFNENFILFSHSLHNVQSLLYTIHAHHIQNIEYIRTYIQNIILNTH